MSDRISVNDMARALHERIKQYGVKAVFDQLDPDFKANEKKTLEGIKTKEKNKIRFTSFEKGYERLLKNKKTIENMTFGIRGNPLLLLNVFKILGIKGFEDLTNDTFAESDPKAKLFIIDSKVDNLQEQIEILGEKLETNMRRRSRITVVKAAFDFEDVTNRLLNILENDSDLTTDFITPLIAIKDIKNFYDNINNQNMIIENYYQLIMHAKQMKKNAWFNSIAKSFFGGISGTYKRALYFYWILCEYKEYCFFHLSLRRYYKLVVNEKYLDDIISVASCNAYVLSPLFISLFYLIIALQYIKRIGYNINIKNNEISDKDIIEKIKKYFEQSNNNHTITISKYYELMTSKLIKQISKIVKPYILYEYSLPKKSYEKYQNILQKIISLYKTTFIDTEKSLLKKIKQCYGIKNFWPLFFMKENNFCGLLVINKEIMDEYEIILNDISILARNMLRDLHG
jgi:hypothetical protein